MGTGIEDSAETMCFTFSPLSSRSPSHFTNQSPQKDSAFDRSTGFSAGPLSGASATCTHERVYAAFARGGDCDIPLPFDCLVAKGEQALSSYGERDYLVGIGAVPVRSSVAGVERVQHALPTPIDARQVDNPVEDDRWRKRDTGITPQALVPEDCPIRAAQRIGSISVEVQDVLCKGGRVVPRGPKLVSPVQTSVVPLQGIEVLIARADIDTLVVDDRSHVALAQWILPAERPRLGV